MKDTGKQIVWLVIGAIVFMIVYTLWTNPSMITNFFYRVQNNLPSSLENNGTQTDSLVSSCTASLNSCREILNKKYGASFSVIETEKFEVGSEAQEFYATWGGFGQTDLDTSLRLYNNANTPIESNYPLVLFALRISGQGGQMPLVAICDKSGTIIKLTKQQLFC